MDIVISIDDAAGFLINPPNMASRPNFFKVRALRIHIAKGLRQINHPTRPAHGWSGMATEPALYALVDSVPFVMPADPGPIAVYLTADTNAEMKMKNATFIREKNMFTSSDNIARAVTKLLKSGIEEKYQTSDTVGLVGWHNAMTVSQILTQLEANYGRPDPSAIQANETKWNAPHNPTDSPETLFHKMEQCQEVAMLADNEYSEKQIMAKTVEHLKRSNIFPVKEYEDWGAVTPKTYIALKRHFYNAYTRRLDAIQNGLTTGMLGYSNPNQYAALTAATDGVGSDSDSTGGDTTETIIAAALASTEAKMDGIMETNRQIMVQLAAMTIAPAATQVIAPAYMAPAYAPPPVQYNPPPTNYYNPPVQQVNVPTQFGYNTQRQPRQGGGRNGGGGRGGGRGRGPRTPFANYVARGNTQQNAPAYGGGTVATSVLTAGTQQFTTVPNIVKAYNNWNMCYSCGFDVEDAHTSESCPQQWRKPGHQTGCNRNNYQQYIAQGHKPRMKGAHKTQLPTM